MRPRASSSSTCSGGAAALQQLARALELGRAQLLVMAVQRGDRRHHRAALEPAQEALGLRGDHLLGLHHRLLADLQVVLDDVRQVVDAVEEHVVELRRLGLDVARHREVDDEHRRVPARLDHALEQALAEDRQRARRAGDDDVELAAGASGISFSVIASAPKRVGELRGRARACGWRW